MFGFAKIFNKPLINWNVGNVINMQAMFLLADAFNQGISSWNVSKVNNMDRIFENTYSFNQNLTKWCVANFDSEPENFALNSKLELSYRPVWGTCPE